MGAEQKVTAPGKVTPDDSIADSIAHILSDISNKPTVSLSLPPQEVGDLSSTLGTSIIDTIVLIFRGISDRSTTKLVGK